MRKEIVNLRKEHANFKKLLTLLDGQLDLLNGEEEPNYQLMTDILYYMTQYADLVHHRKEEAIFSHLLEQDSSVEKDVAEVAQQHRTIEKYGANFFEKLDDIINGQRIMPLQEIEKTGHLYSTTQRAHLNQENNNLFGLANRILNDEDWKKIETETQSEPDPIFGEAIKDRFHLVCDQLARSSSDEGQQAWLAH